MSAFEKEIDNATTTVKSLQDAAKEVADAQKAVDETETELEKLTTNARTRMQTLREVKEQSACRCSTNVRVNLPFAHPHRKHAQKLFKITLDNSR